MDSCERPCCANSQEPIIVTFTASAHPCIAAPGTRVCVSGTATTPFDGPAPTGSVRLKARNTSPYFFVFIFYGVKKGYYGVRKLGMRFALKSPVSQISDDLLGEMTV